MNFKQFSILLTIRISLIIVTLLILGLLFTTSGYHTTTFLTLLVLIIQTVFLVRFVSKTNHEVIRFLDAINHADYTQRFELDYLGSGFGELGQAFTQSIKRFEAAQAKQAIEQKYLKAIIEHVPVPLLSITNGGTITLCNHAARQLFGTNHVTKLADLKLFGEEFATYLAHIKAGEKRLLGFTVDGMEHQLSITATQILLPENQQMLVSMQDIQSELDSAQLNAWQDLVKVLTHEIMNSITPVASLAKTAVQLVENAKNKAKTLSELDDISDAVSTVARRSDGLMHFVTSYRKLTQLPTANIKLIHLEQLFQHVKTLCIASWQQQNITFDIQIIPSELEVYADVEMLTQVLLNLLKNAEHAVQNCQQPLIKLIAYLNPRGHVVIDVSDNGTGIPDELLTQIFVPFYTTKAKGSGVGLALTRQIMRAHKGTIKLTQNTKKGATFSLVF